MKQFKSTYFLFFLVVVVVSYAYFFEYKGSANKKIAEEKNKVIIPYSLDDITAFTIINPAGKLVYQKTKVGVKNVSAPTWEIIEPIKDLADSNEIQGFLSQLAGEKYIEEVADGTKEKIDYSIFGLDSASGKDKTSKLILKYPDKTWEVEVGTAAGLSGRRYIRVNDENKVFLANYTWQFQLDKKITDMRDKSLVPQGTDLSSFTIKNSRGDLNFINDNAQWVLTDLKTHDPDTKAIDEIRNHILELRATNIVSEEKTSRVLKASGLSPASLVIKLIDKNKKETDISFGKSKDGKIFAIENTRPCVFEIAEDVFKNYADKNTQDFRNKRKPLEFAISQAKEIDFKSDMNSFRIIKVDNNWQLAKSEAEKTVDSAKVSDLLNKLSTMKVKKYFDSGINYQKSGMENLIIRGENKTLLDLKWSPKAIKDIFVGTSQLTNITFGLDTKDVESLAFKDIVQTKKTEIKKPEGKK